MAPGRNADDFNAIINADRQRRKNEALAQEIFGKGRRSSAPGAGAGAGVRKPGTGPSLASRVGITKRNSSANFRPAPKSSASRPSAGNVDAEWTHDLHGLNNPSTSRAARTLTRTERLYAAFSNDTPSKALSDQVNIVKNAPSKSFSIRGLAGPCTVIAKNFAHGTTAADIESAMVQVGGVILDCRLLSERPNVVAEITFETKEGGDAVVATFDKQNADGNILHVYHRPGPVAGTTSQSSSVPATRMNTPRGPRAETFNGRSDNSHMGGADRYDDRRRDSKRDEVIDGSYGFDDRMDTDDQAGQGRGQGLYSDEMVDSRARGRDNTRDPGRSYYSGRGRR